MNIIDAISDQNLYAPWFPGESWGAWRTVLKAIFAIPMTDAEKAFFRTIAERDPPAEPVKEVWIVAGRRAGKDSVASVLVAHLAAMFENTDRLRPGERAVVLCLATDRDQAKIIFGYTQSYFQDIPLLAGLVQRETASGLELNNRVDVAIATNSFRSLRGRPVLAAVLDECAFYRDDSSATPDEETYAAIKPGTATLPDSIIIGISSPYRKSGLLYKKYEEHFGKDSKVLVIKAPSTVLNPTLDPEIIADAMRDDPAVASAEWMAEFRNDISAYIPIEAVRACVANGVMERKPERIRHYVAFVDVAGGSGKDSMTLAIAHKEGADESDTVILDAIREVRPPFSPEAVVQEMCDLLRSYRVSRVVGDRFGGDWPRESFRRFGVHYEIADRSRSDLYVALLPLINSRAVDLLDNDRLITQLALLERRATRGGKDAIDHAPGAHDDVANSVAGACVLATTAKRRRPGGPGGVAHESAAKFNPITYGVRH
ncbi:hypothetical protein [Bradyrhizobium diazoefficiens]|uniref:Terminase n=1 Tax=Bradyrhizobium diazoefficiens TaxID=1355477 RepID=A0A809X3Y4_9BRAD|nr:hypothetical protein XF1B_51830 [Bradyrhizobium diazoefficiens]BCE48766.1 hypothetical protein XF4B_51150 [Bradyrhizobium diazoefficiens]BCE92281.1 hypothetical protein XF10B_50790 [Bradyrhizobium diazoefficiens]BCF27209.1 hypothetical protein XF14B_51610 [Bradyrhizobium diazoefficiens]